MQISGLGIDAVEIARFKTALKQKKDRFFVATFTDEERSYCLSYKDSAIHFAGIFAAKEALCKASGARILLSEFEIKHLKSGQPEVWLKGKRAKSYLVSVTHEKTFAFAAAIKV